MSRVYASTTDATASLTSVYEASPLGRTAIVPWVLSPVQEGAWVCAMVELSGSRPRGGSVPGLAAVASFDAEMHGNDVAVTWPDGTRTVTRFTGSHPISGLSGSGEHNGPRNQAMNSGGEEMNEAQDQLARRPRRRGDSGVGGLLEHCGHAHAGAANSHAGAGRHSGSDSNAGARHSDDGGVVSQHDAGIQESSRTRSTRPTPTSRSS